MKYLLRGLFLFTILACANILDAQTLPPNRAEQDACGALVICGNSFTTQYSYDGNGYVNDLPNTPCSAPGSSTAGEDNAVWLRLNIITGGDILFTVSPLDPNDDYDWAVVNITGKTCSTFTFSDVVRCNFNNNFPPYNNGVTGLDNISTLTGAPSGVTGDSYLKKLTVAAGDSYLIMVNNFGSGNGQNNSLGSGFTINFSGSTAIFNNPNPPAFQEAAPSCFVGTNTIIDLNKEILCSSIASNGSDFLITPSGTISSVQGLNCNNVGQGYTTEIGISFNPALAPGTYYLKAKNGSDNNTLLDLCGNAVSLNDSIKFVVYPNNSTSQNITVEGCGSVVYHGVTYTESQTITDTTFTSYGCDSIYNKANLIVYKDPTIVSETISSCDSVVFRGITYTEATAVADTFKNHLGCDSLVHIYNIDPQHLILTMTVDPPEPVIGDYVVITISSNLPDYSVQAWYPQDIFKNQFATSQNFFIQHSDTMMVIGRSSGGCIDTLKTFVKADTLVPVLVMPNAFSPNGDGLNDVFEPKFVNKSGFLVKDFRIFDRWGKLVYSAAATKKSGWNGNYSNDDKPAAVGTYFFYIDVQFIDGTKRFFKGDVTLIR